MTKQEMFMQEALIEARKAFLKNEVPVGCVIVLNDKIISRAHNQRETLNSTLAHAELKAIEKANKELGSWRLEECEIYVTLEPCAMCAGAIIQARMKHLIYGATDVKSGALGGNFQILDNNFNHELKVTKGILDRESTEMLKSFFKKLRK